MVQGESKGTWRLEPSGNVTVISFIENLTERLLGGPTFARFASYGGQPSQWLANRSSRGRWQAGAKVGRHGQTRTADLLRVKQAL